MKVITYILFLISLSSCSGPNCESIPISFESSNNALIIVEQANFNLHETIDSSSSSWIVGFTYYSCDKETGFLVLETKKKKYIHQGVPISLWNKLKKAPSFGAFYNAYIRGNYGIEL